MVFNFLKKKSEFNTQEKEVYAYLLANGLTPNEQHAEAYERYKRQIAQADQRLNAQVPTKATPDTPEIVQETPRATPGPATKKPYNVAKDTTLVRLHNDLINKIKEQKGSKTFNEFLTEKLGV